MKWSKRSVKNINTVNKVLQILAQKIIEKLVYDVGVLDTGGFRTSLQQNKIFKTGNSECDGIIKKSYHQTGMAIDFVPYINGEFTWNNKLAFLTNAKTIFECWKEMEESGETEDYYLHGGIFWGDQDLDGDGLLEITDKLGWDMAHFELRDFLQKDVIEISI